MLYTPKFYSGRNSDRIPPTVQPLCPPQLHAPPLQSDSGLQTSTTKPFPFTFYYQPNQTKTTITNPAATKTTPALIPSAELTKRPKLSQPRLQHIQRNEHDVM